MESGLHLFLHKEFHHLESHSHLYLFYLFYYFFFLLLISFYLYFHYKNDNIPHLFQNKFPNQNPDYYTQILFLYFDKLLYILFFF